MPRSDRYEIVVQTAASMSVGVLGDSGTQAKRFKAGLEVSVKVVRA